MNLYYGIAVVVRLLFALLIGKKEMTAYLWYLLKVLVGVQAEESSMEDDQDAYHTPEPNLTPSLHKRSYFMESD